MPDRQVKIIRRTAGIPVRVRAGTEDMRSEIINGKKDVPATVPGPKAPVKIAASAPMEVKKLRVAGYCRVSTGQEGQETSIISQREHYEESISCPRAGIIWWRRRFRTAEPQNRTSARSSSLR